MIKIKGKVFKSGGSYAVRIPKALIDCEVFKDQQDVTLTYSPADQDLAANGIHKYLFPDLASLSRTALNAGWGAV